MKFLFILIFCITLSFANEVEKLVILGSGPAALTAAIFAGQAHLHPLVVEGKESERQLTSVYKMENYPGFPEGITGEELVARIRVQAEKFGTRFKTGAVVDVNLEHKPFRLIFDDGTVLYSHAIIVAVGTMKRWLGLNSEKALMDKGVSGSAICDTSFFHEKEVVVIGGGDAALEEALALAEVASKVTLIHRSSTLNAATYLKEKVFATNKIDVLLNAQVEDILDVSIGKVKGVELRDLITGVPFTLPCEGVVVSIGRKPNTAMFKNQLKLSHTGLIATESHGTQTSVTGVFAAGEVSDPTYRKAITSAASGCMAAMDAIKFLISIDQL